MRITEMQISPEEKRAKQKELRQFAEDTFGKRLGLDLNEVLFSIGLIAKSQEAKFSMSMASLDPKLNLTDDEHEKMAELLENI